MAGSPQTPPGLAPEALLAPAITRSALSRGITPDFERGAAGCNCSLHIHEAMPLRLGGDQPAQVLFLKSCSTAARSARASGQKRLPSGMVGSPPWMRSSWMSVRSRRFTISSFTSPVRERPCS